MNDPEILSITKLDAARRQLRTAIELWFANGDPISIHTLACAAHQIIHDLNRIKKGPPLLLDTDIVKDEHRKDYVNLVKTPENFFKHADLRKQQITSLDFNPGVSDGIICFSVYGINVLGESLNAVEAAYMTWTIIHKPHFLKPHARKRLSQNIPIEILEELRSAHKNEFFECYLAISRKTNRKPR